MSYDIAVWEGPAPTDHALAASEFVRHSAGAEEQRPPSPKIRRFVEALLARHPDLTELDDAEVDDSPWADGPLIGNASGSFIYFALVHSRAKEVLPFIVETAAPERLVVYDPQTERLLTDGPERKRRSWWRRS